MFGNRLRSVLKIFKRSYASKVELVVNPWAMRLSPNGLRTVKECRCAPFETIVLLIEAGPRYEIECNHGVTYFLEHMIHKGLTTKFKAQFTRHLEDLGVRMWTNTCRALQEITFVTPQKNVSPILHLICEIFEQLNPLDTTIEEVRQAIVEQIVDHERDIRSMIMDYAHQAAFCGTPLSKPVIGPIRTMCDFNREFLLSYFCHHYQPTRMVISASGPMPIPDFLDIVSQTLACIPARCIVPDDCGTRFTGSQVLYRNDDIPHTHCVLAVEACGYNSPVYLRQRCLKHVLGFFNPSIGGGIKAWPITAQAAEIAKLCVQYESFYYFYRDVGLWGIYFASDVMATDNMIMWVLDTFLHTGTTLSKADFERARNSLRLELFNELCSSIGSARNSAIEVMYTCKRSTLSDWVSLLDNMTVEEIKELAHEIFYEREIVVAGYGKTATINELSRIRSYMYWLRF